MAKQRLVLQYIIICDPGETGWTSGFEFEKQFKDFLLTRNLSGNVPVTDGNTGVRILEIGSTDKFDQLNEVNTPEVDNGPTKD